MVFSSVVFLGIFLPVVLVLYFIIKNRVWRNCILLIASLVFYAWGEPVWIFSMIALTFLDFLAGLFLEKVSSEARRKTLLVLVVILNLALLFVFKYLNFFIDNINNIANTSIGHFPYAMPIGISFFTFQALTYVVDVYRRQVGAQRNYAYLLLYISMFPQLIAGPIVRYSDIAEMINNRKETMDGFVNGGLRFVVGLGKKVIFANYAGAIATSLLTDQISTLSASGAWVGILMYTLQIYFDFSGYSDMAIGLGKIFAFDFKENFNYPYIARSVTDFWRRWHISLSSFFRDYVYIPLGGNRKHQFLNIFIVWCLTGFWHGASWNFLLWGLYFALLLMAEKKLKTIGIDTGKIPVISNILLLLIVVFSWGIFYYTDLNQLGMFFSSLFGLGNTTITLSLKESTTIFQYFWLIPIMILAVTPWPTKLANKIFKDGTIAKSVARTVCTVGLLAICYVLILNQTYNPFLYFRF